MIKVKMGGIGKLTLEEPISPQTTLMKVQVCIISVGAGVMLM